MTKSPKEERKEYAREIHLPIIQVLLNFSIISVKIRLIKELALEKKTFSNWPSRKKK